MGFRLWNVAPPLAQAQIQVRLDVVDVEDHQFGRTRAVRPRERIEDPAVLVMPAARRARTAVKSDNQG